MAQEDRHAVERRPESGILPDRAQPHDPAVERAVLAAMLREPESCVDQVIMQLHDDTVFYSHVHREIFRVILALHSDQKKAVDLVSVAHELQISGKLEAVGGEVFLADLAGSISTTVNLEAWCDILKKYAILRKMIDGCSESLGKCYDPDADAAKLIDQIETDVYKVRGEEATSNIVEIKKSIRTE